MVTDQSTAYTRGALTLHWTVVRGCAALKTPFSGHFFLPQGFLAPETHYFKPFSSFRDPDFFTVFLIETLYRENVSFRDRDLKR